MLGNSSNLSNQTYIYNDIDFKIGENIINNSQSNKSIVHRKNNIDGNLENKIRKLNEFEKIEEKVKQTNLKASKLMNNIMYNYDNQKNTAKAINNTNSNETIEKIKIKYNLDDLINL